MFFLVLFATFTLFSFVGGLRLGRRTATPLQSRDTVFVTKTVYEENPTPSAITLKRWDITVPKIYFSTDTLTLVDTLSIPAIIHDTLYTPIREYYYEQLDGRLRLWIDGYDVNLNRWELDEQTAIIQERRRWSFSVGVGPSVIYSPFHNSIDAGLGIFGGITYSF